MLHVSTDLLIFVAHLLITLIVSSIHLHQMLIPDKTDKDIIVVLINCSYSYHWRVEWICCRYLDVQDEVPSFIGCVGRASYFTPQFCKTVIL